MTKRRKKQARSYVIHLKIREIAEAKGITRTQLSRRADINYATVNAIWNNPQHDVSIKLLEKIAGALGVEISDLYDVLPDDDSMS